MDEIAIVQHLRERLPGVAAIYLFGSVASGDAGPQSDFDLAVLVDGSVEPVVLWRVANELANLSRRDVDLVDLRAASTVMQNQILTNGRALWRRDASASLFEVFALNEMLEVDARRAAQLSDIAREGRIHAR